MQLDDFWDDAPVISSYSRAQAIEDGVLTPVEALVPDEQDFAKQAGWKVPIALTAAVVSLVVPSDRERDELAQSVKGRLWDVLMLAFLGSQTTDSDQIVFPVIFQFAGRSDRRWGRTHQTTVRLKVIVGPGDQWEPVATFMLPEES